MAPKNIPQDINIELLLSYFPEGSCKIALKGHHKRNAYYDIIDIEEKPDGIQHLDIGRNGLYHVLPEYMFHPIDRFSNLPRLEEKERFAEELEKQELEKERAYKFFAPVDVRLLLQRVEVWDKLHEMTAGNKILLDILGDRLSEQQRNNRFVRGAIPFLPYCKQIRGDKTLLSFLLRKIFMDEGLLITLKENETECCDIEPRYADGLDAELNDSFVGHVYDELITTYDIHYWSGEECNEHFLQFVDDVEEFRQFVEDYLMSVEEVLHFDITHDEVPLRLSDDIIYNYLDYNTNI